MRMLIISGLSGAGKSKAGEALEDAGFYIVDNMPAELMPRFAELRILDSKAPYDRVALISDIRGGKNFDELFTALDAMKAMGIDCKLLFLEASTPAIIQRYKETRRSHPLAVGEVSLSQAVEREKELLRPVRERADYIIDSTHFRTNAKLRSVLLQMFGEGGEQQLQVSVQSFGYKYGLPLEADLVLDVRFLPNPFYKPELRQHSGLEESVRTYLFRYEETTVFLRKMEDLLRFLLPLYEEEGKSTLVIAIGCTGGQHRSVAMTHAIVEQVRTIGYPVTESHRDMTRERK